MISTLPKPAVGRTSVAPAGLLLALLLAGSPAVPTSPGPLGGATTLAAQVPDFERGVVGAGLALRRVEGVKRVLMIAAHPDDEDTALLASLARGDGAETAYLSLTRGDGGQNLVGPKLGEGLGIVRTGELLAARELDGARQYFTRAFDFGYSKTADETLELWPRDEVLRDVTWVVRTFRPQVIVSVFSGTSSDGHGHHQAAGILSREVFRVAADPTRFPEMLEEGAEPWQPSKLYTLAWRAPGEATTRVSTGAFDPLLGRSHYQLAMESRSQHRSQDMGTAQPPGPRTSALILEETAPGVDASGSGIFAGVDTTLAGAWVDPLPSGPSPRARSGASPGARPRDRAAALLESYREAIDAARAGLGALDPGEAVPPLARALEALDRLEPLLSRDGGEMAVRTLDRVRGDVAEALADAAGVVTDVAMDDDLLVPGQEVQTSVVLWNGGSRAVVDARPRLDLPEGWEAEALGADEGDRPRRRFRSRGGARSVDPGPVDRLDPGEAVVWRYRVRVPADAAPSEPYYLEAPRDGAMYRWPDDPGLRARPGNPPLVTGGATYRVEAGGSDGSPALTASAEAVHVAVDKALGETRVPVAVVPAASVALEPEVVVWPTDAREPRTVSVVLRAFAPEGVGGRVRLEVPPGWRADPASAEFDLATPGEERSVAFSLVPPPRIEPGRLQIRAVAETRDGRSLDETLEIVDHPHIDRVTRVLPAVTRITAVPVQVAAGLRVGYVMGSGDDVFDAIRELGVRAELLSPDQVLGGDLGAYDVIVLGVRAYETRPDVRAANPRLLDFAREGGTLLVQYNKYEFPRGDFAPWPVEMSRPHDRVTDEGSPVRLLDPDSPVFARPNRITDADFEGWVTERGLYFLGEWDEDRYTPLLEMEDPGEAPKRGALLVAPLGEGLYVYTGLSFFRQLPAGVPGAYRLFANLLSLDARAWHGGSTPDPEEGR